MADNKSREVVGIESTGGASYGEWGLFAETADGCKYAITEKEYDRLCGDRRLVKSTDGSGKPTLDFSQVIYEANEDGSPITDGCRSETCHANCRGECRKGSGDITIKVTADMAEAITGFKALQRELRETTKVLREYETAVESIDGNFRIGTHSGEASIVTTSELKSGDPSIGRDTDFVYRHEQDDVEEYTYDFGISTHGSLNAFSTKELHEELAKREDVEEITVRAHDVDASVLIKEMNNGIISEEFEVIEGPARILINKD